MIQFITQPIVYIFLFSIFPHLHPKLTKKGTHVLELASHYAVTAVSQLYFSAAGVILYFWVEKSPVHAIHPAVEILLLGPILSYQVWNLAISFQVAEFRGAENWVHHVGAVVATGLCMYTRRFHYALIFFEGLIEVSSMLLNWALMLELVVPPTKGNRRVVDGFKLAFAVSFILLRNVWLPFWAVPIAVDSWREVFYGSESGFLLKVIWVFFAPVIALQYFWGYKIVRRLCREFSKPPLNNVDKNSVEKGDIEKNDKED